MRILHAKMYLNGIIENNKDNPDMQNIIGQIKKALKELEGDITKFNVVRYWGTYADGLIATCDTKEEAEKICKKYNKKHRCNFKYHYEVKIDDKKKLFTHQVKARVPPI